MDTIIVRRGRDQDASRVASLAARASGTTLAGNLRWYGPAGPQHREAPTADGRLIRVVEPDSTDPRAITVEESA